MILLPLLAVVAVFWPTFVGLHRQWTDWTNTTVTHGYLIAAICLWLLWRKRAMLRTAVAPPDRWSIAALGGIALLWLFVRQAGIQIAEFALLPVLFYLAVRASLGRFVAASACFPIFYLYSAIPIWSLVNGIFQWSSVYAVRFALRAVGIPAFFEGNRVHIPDGTFEIAGGCSGLHFVVVGVSMALLLAELRGDGWRGRLKLAGIALALAVVTNWVRVFSIILIGHVSHMQNYLVARSHYGYGWILFSVAMAVLLLIERHIPVRQRAEAGGPRDAWRQTKPLPLAPLLSVLTVLAIARLWHSLAMRPAEDGIIMPSVPTTWSAVGTSTPAWKPRFEGADSERTILYRTADGADAQIYLALYRTQQQGKELGGYDNDALGGQALLESKIQSIESTPALLQRARGPDGEHVVVTSYRVARRHFASASSAQLWYALRSLLSFRSAASQVVLRRSACQPDCESAANRLREIKE